MLIEKTRLKIFLCSFLFFANSSFSLEQLQVKTNPSTPIELRLVLEGLFLIHPELSTNLELKEVLTRLELNSKAIDLPNAKYLIKSEFYKSILEFASENKRKVKSITKENIERLVEISSALQTKDLFLKWFIDNIIFDFQEIFKTFSINNLSTINEHKMNLLSYWGQIFIDNNSEYTNEVLKKLKIFILNNINTAFTTMIFSSKPIPSNKELFQFQIIEVPDKSPLEESKKLMEKISVPEDINEATPKQQWTPKEE